MHKFFFLLPAIVSATLLFGCADQQRITSSSEPNDLIVLIPDQNGKVGEITISNRAGTTTLSRANESIQVTNNSIPHRTRVLTDRTVQKNFHDTLQAIPGTADHYILYFTSGTTQLTQESSTQLAAIINKIKERLPCQISIIGHTDTKANNEYNLALALRRATHVKNQLLAIGAPRKLLEVSSHGENDPMIPTADNVAEPKNRRVEIFIR
ncbi:MAG: OmpA family protein [Candidatus Electrothrix sp. ATG2]|nr:OmpA family protein [Candidatus Electrothrix sp. ATG2]